MECTYSVAPPQLTKRVSDHLRLTTPRRSRIALLCGCLAALITVLNVLSIWPLLQGQTDSRVRASARRPLPDFAAANSCKPVLSRHAAVLSPYAAPRL